MTEDEALQSWCPFARAIRWDEATERMNGPYNRIRTDADVTSSETAWQIEAYCVGRACMAWRWAEPSNKGSTEGYCGLAGRP